jgi:site-specific DNA-methyltransferase (adenine-specific)
MNTLYFGDNLEILRDKIPSNYVDLIYLDPPFKSGKSYNIIFQPELNKIKGATAQIKTFEDTWRWGDEAENEYQGLITGTITKEKPSQKLIDLIKAMRGYLGECSMMAYFSMMAPRLVEMRRVMKGTGSIYLHCDPTASHYLKLLMDAVFGTKNFQNEIVWCYKLGGRPKKGFPKKHDVILYYSKSENFNFFDDAIRVPYESDGGYISSGRKIVKGKIYEVNPLGKVPEDWWFISALNRQEKERLGYPTQKPEVLLEGVRLTLRLKIGKMMLEEIQPEVFPSIAQYEGTKSQNSLTSVDGPSHARFFHPCADQVLAGGFHYPTAYW